MTVDERNVCVRLGGTFADVTTRQKGNTYYKDFTITEETHVVANDYEPQRLFGKSEITL